MNIIDQYHVIEHITPNILSLIEIAGRNCWKSEGKMNTCTLNEDDDCELFPGLVYEYCEHPECKYHSTQKFVRNIIKRKHESILEFGDICVRLITNRGVTHELVRHRIGMSYAQESTRYVNYNGKMEFIRPVWCSDSLIKKSDMDRLIDSEELFIDNCIDSEELFIDNCIDSEEYYQLLISKGWRPEQAREVLPNSLKTEIIVKGNIRSWRNMFKLRTSKKAHPQIRDLMITLLNDLKTKIPVVFDDIKV